MSDRLCRDHHATLCNGFTEGHETFMCSRSCRILPSDDDHPLYGLAARKVTPAQATTEGSQS